MASPDTSERMNRFRTQLSSSARLILDGAMGTELQRRGVITELPLWSAGALITHQELVRDIHLEYLRAGADIITTNTFRTGVRPVRNVDLSVSAAELTHTACRLAHEARTAFGDPNRMIAGCVATLEDCYEPELTPSDSELRNEHTDLVRALHSGGVDFIFAETMNSVRESVAVLDAAQRCGIPAAISFVCDASGTLLSGEPLCAALTAVSPYAPLFVGANCAPPERITKAVDSLVTQTALSVCVYANGMGQPGGPLGWIFGELGSESIAYANHAQQWVECGVKIIGGCCGTTPDYIAALANGLRS